MNKILFAVIIGCYCALLAESFLLGHKYKDACDPNPCKHKGECKLDPKNKNISTCVCDENHHGKLCENKTGCANKPCKHGATCTNNRLNKNDYTCACKDDYVGKDCDKKDYCKKKNPCKNGAKCVIDKKGDPACECPPGYGSKHCDTLQCNITEYKIKSMTKKSDKLWLNTELADRVKQIDDLAKLCRIHLHIVKSHIQHPDPAKGKHYDYKDKTHATYYIGHAFGFNIHDTKDNLLCNDICLGKIPCPVTEAKCFIDGLHAIKWKWSALDPKTVHTDYNYANLNNYNAKRESIQVGCSKKKFTF